MWFRFYLPFECFNWRHKATTGPTTKPFIVLFETFNMNTYLNRPGYLTNVFYPFVPVIWHMSFSKLSLALALPANVLFLLGFCHLYWLDMFWYGCNLPERELYLNRWFSLVYYVIVIFASTHRAGIHIKFWFMIVVWCIARVFWLCWFDNEIGMPFYILDLVLSVGVKMG